MGLCVIPNYYRRGYATGSSVYSGSDPSLCVRVVRYAIPGESSVWSACCSCLFAQLAQLCVCVCVPIGTLLAHVVFLIPCREKELVHCVSSF
jgi:hypothetical protein